MMLQDGSTDTRHDKTDLIGMHRRWLQLMDTDDAGTAHAATPLARLLRPPPPPLRRLRCLPPRRPSGVADLFLRRFKVGED
uniref:Uncharacterized protein K0063H06.9 n=1 Tax=Oryza sativa subsp. indica TaxID=39946 RepID=C8TF12_ORYSI|nr:hypothetical protein [Oryza sativa Indica Group]